MLSQLLYSEDLEILADSCWVVAFLSDGPNQRIQRVIDGGLSRRLVELLFHLDRSVVTPALRAVGNIVTGDDVQTQVRTCMCTYVRACACSVCVQCSTSAVQCVRYVRRWALTKTNDATQTLSFCKCIIICTTRCWKYFLMNVKPATFLTCHLFVCLFVCLFVLVFVCVSLAHCTGHDQLFHPACPPPPVVQSP